VSSLPGPTVRLALLLGLIALSALVLPSLAVVLLALGLAGAAVADARIARRRPSIDRTVPSTLALGTPAPLEAEAAAPDAGTITLRQPSGDGIRVAPPEAQRTLLAEAVPSRRGRHVLPPLTARSEGPLGLMCADHSEGAEAEVTVYPDLPAAQRMAVAVRSGRFREEGRRGRGPLGLGTEFESIRDYSPDDDIRQVNWRATQRLGRPMSNQYRVEQDRDLICLVDAGRLMRAPLGDRTRLDVALDAVAAVGLVADALGDRCGCLAFDSAVLRELTPRRAGGRAVVRALFDLEPSPVDSDYELAFRSVGGRKRALVLLFTDILEETAARPLVEAVPVLGRRHVVAVASAADPDLNRIVTTVPASARGVHTQTAALEVLDARRRVRTSLSASGAQVIEAPPGQLGAACVQAYLKAKAQARL
jgi:uncharacterized protein (DUF58 family)